MRTHGNKSQNWVTTSHFGEFEEHFRDFKVGITGVRAFDMRQNKTTQETPDIASVKTQ